MFLLYHYYPPKVLALNPRALRVWGFKGFRAHSEGP